MKFNTQTWGSGLELFGLILLLLGSFWQTTLSGWWDKQIPEWQYYIQNEVNLTVLSTLQNISDMQATDDKNLKDAISKQVSDNINTTRSFVFKERDKRHEAMKNGQAATFWSIERYLVILGALFLVLGKWFTWAGHRQQVSNNAKKP